MFYSIRSLTRFLTKLTLTGVKRLNRSPPLVPGGGAVRGARLHPPRAAARPRSGHHRIQLTGVVLRG